MKNYLLLFFCIYSFCGYSQRIEGIEGANRLMKEQNFLQAAEQWNTIVDSSMGNANIFFKLGLCYYKSYDHQLQSLDYFKKSITNTRAGYSFGSAKIVYAPIEAFFFLGESFMVNNQPDSALYYYNLYKKKGGDMSLYPVDKRINCCINALRLKSEPLNIIDENLGNNVNSRFSETHPVVVLNSSVLFFASRRPKVGEPQDVSGNDDDIYMSLKLPKGVWSKATMLPFCTNANEYPACVSADGRMLIFAREVNGNCDLFSVTYSEGEWGNPVSLGKNVNSGADESEASMTLDGKLLYFSSNRDNDDGTYDIYVSAKKLDGNWGKAEKLPFPVNTSGDERYPYIHPEGHTLFYCTNSSDDGVGNFDIFYAKKSDSHKWSTPKILRYPLNTSADNLGFSIVAEGKRYASRLTGFNSYDIVEFVGNEKYLDDFGMSADASKMVSELNVMETFEVEKIVEKEVQVTDVVEVQTEITKEIKKQEEDSIKSYSIDNLDLEKIDSTKREMIFQKVKDYYTNLFKTDKRVLFKTLYFNFNSAELLLLSQNELRLLIEYMNEHRDVKVEVIGHTDILGNWDVNLNVSRDRAYSVYQFLIKNNIAHNRIIYYGKGSADPIASNDDDKGRSKNRRVEIMLLK